MSKRKIVILLIALLIFGSLGAYFVVKQRGGADVAVETGTLSGTVTEVETGLPIAGAKLWLSNPAVLGREMIIITTDESGEFVKEGLPPAEGYLIKIASAPGFKNEYLVGTQKTFNAQANSESDLIAKISNTPDYQTNNKLVILTEKLNFSAPEIGENYFSYKIRKNAVNALSINLEPGDEENLPPPDGSFFNLEDNDYFVREKTERENILNELAKELPEQAEMVRKIENESGWQIPEEGTTMSMIDPAITEILNKAADERNNNEQPTRANQQGQCTQEDLAALQQVAGSIIRDYQSLERVIATRLNKDQRTKEKYAWLLPLLYAQHKLGPSGHWTLFMKMAGDPLWKPSKILDKSVWNRKENEKYKALLYNIYWPEWAHLYNRPTFTESEKKEIINTINFMRLVDWGWDAIDPPICEDIWSILNVMMMGTGAVPRAMALGDMAKLNLIRSGNNWLVQRTGSRALQRVISAGTKTIEIIWVENLGLGIVFKIASKYLGEVRLYAGNLFYNSLLSLTQQKRASKLLVEAWEGMVENSVFKNYFNKDLILNEYAGKTNFAHWSFLRGSFVDLERKEAAREMKILAGYYDGRLKMVFLGDHIFDPKKYSHGDDMIKAVITHESLHKLFDNTPMAPNYLIDEAFTDFFTERISGDLSYYWREQDITEPIYAYFLKKHQGASDSALKEMVDIYYKGGFQAISNELGRASLGNEIDGLLQAKKYDAIKELIESVIKAKLGS